jgi:hypothetical protein
MLLSTIRVPLPASFFGAVTRISDFFDPDVQPRMDMDRSQVGRWMVMVISPEDDVPRQLSIDLLTMSRASWAGAGAADIRHQISGAAMGVMRFMIVCSVVSVRMAVPSCV